MVNSLMSIRVIDFSSSKRTSANALANSVFPTPVGLKDKKPIGLFGSWSPALDRRTASETARIASSCPYDSFANSSSMWEKLVLLSLHHFCKGIPVQLLTTAAMSLAVTVSEVNLLPSGKTASLASASLSKFSCSLASISIFAMRPKSDSFSFSAAMMISSNFFLWTGCDRRFPFQFSGQLWVNPDSVFSICKIFFD